MPQYRERVQEQDGRGNTATIVWTNDTSGELSVQPPVVLSDAALQRIRERSGVAIVFFASTPRDGASDSAGGTLFEITNGQDAGETATDKYRSAVQAANLIFSYMRKAADSGH